MSNIIREPIAVKDILQNLPEQVCQIDYHNGEHSIDIGWEHETGRIVVNEDDDWFYIKNTDKKNMSILDVIHALGYGNEDIYITWCEKPILAKDILNYPVHDAPLCQIEILIPLPSKVEILKQIALPLALITITLLTLLWI